MIDEDWRVLGAAVLDLTINQKGSECALVSEWLCIPSRSLREVWDNGAEAAYDQL